MLPPWMPINIKVMRIDRSLAMLQYINPPLVIYIIDAHMIWNNVQEKIQIWNCFFFFKIYNFTQE